MVDCPYCHQKIDSRAVTCPYCRATLKAFGHPGMPLHRAAKGEFLCETCLYHADDSCTFPKRPYAKDCTLYEDISQNIPEPSRRSRSFQPLQQTIALWCKRNAGWLILIGLGLLSLFLALAQQNDR